MTSDLSWYDKRINELQTSNVTYQSDQANGYDLLELADLIERRDECYRRYLWEDKQALISYIDNQINRSIPIAFSDAVVAMSPEILLADTTVVPQQVVVFMVSGRTEIKDIVDRRIKAIGRHLGVNCAANKKL